MPITFHLTHSRKPASITCLSACMLFLGFFFSAYGTKDSYNSVFSWTHSMTVQYIFWQVPEYLYRERIAPIEMKRTNDWTGFPSKPLIWNKRHNTSHWRPLAERISSSVLSTQVSYLTDVNVICGGVRRAALDWSNRSRILGVCADTHEDNTLSVTHFMRVCVSFIELDGFNFQFWTVFLVIYSWSSVPNTPCFLDILSYIILYYSRTTPGPTWPDAIAAGMALRHAF